MSWWTVFVILFLFGSLFGGSRSSNRSQDFGGGGDDHCDDLFDYDHRECDYWDDSCDFFDEGD